MEPFRVLYVFLISLLFSLKDMEAVCCSEMEDGNFGMISNTWTNEFCPILKKFYDSGKLICAVRIFRTFNN